MSIDKIEGNDPAAQSKDLLQENINKLKALFPEVVAEGKINFEVLRDILGDEVETEEEYYRFTWAGKSQARREAHKPSRGTLRPAKDESVNWDLTQNLYLEGDNLEVLKLLQKSYAGKVKMIYIDPPYNTGTDFIYKDNYRDNLHNYRQLVGTADNQRNLLFTNRHDNGRFHSNWLNMIYPRLILSKSLLRKDGVIFVSIDDNELSNLITIMKGLFGEENFINIINVKAKDSSGASGGGEDKRLKKNIEYVVCFSRSKYFDKLKSIYSSQKLENYIAERELYGKSFSYTNVLIDQGIKTFKRKIKDGFNNDIEIYEHDNYVIKTISQIQKEEGLSRNECYLKYFEHIFTTENAQTSIRDRVKKSTANSDGLISINYKPVSGRNKGVSTRVFFIGHTKRLVSFIRNVAVKQNGDIVKRNKIGTLWNDLSWSSVSLEGQMPFSNGKKPTKLIQRFLKLSDIENNDVILDFFSGSSSTAHGVIEYNSENSVNCRYIQVQIPETVGETESKNYDGLKTISDVGKERIRRAGQKIKQDKEAEWAEKETALKKLQNKGELFEADEEKVKTLQEEITKLKDVVANLDIGFKVFKLDSSNIRPWDGRPENLEDNLFKAVTNLKEDRSEEDILYEILLKYGIDLTVVIEERELGGETVYSVSDGAIFICLGNKITTAVAEGIGAWKEELESERVRVVFKDSGLTDVAKTNATQILKRYGVEEVRSI